MIVRMTLPILRAPIVPTAALKYLSQSEGGDWQSCPLKAFARWILEYRAPGDEARPQMVGSIGHAILSERTRARFDRREPNYPAAIHEEAQRRGWESVSQTDVDRAAFGAEAIAAEVGLDRVALVPDLYSEDPPGGGSVRRGPLAEVRLRATWAKLGEFFREADRRSVSPGWADIMACEAVRARFAGIEGQPDSAIMPDGPGGPVVVPDWKFRQNPDIGGAAADPDSAVPDRQCSWYTALLYAVGLRPAGGIEFWQVNAYAGRWLDVEDFIRAADGEVDSPEGAALVTDVGLPTRDLNRIGKLGMVSAEVWGEAFRVLANRRHDRRLAEWYARPLGPKGGKGMKKPERLTGAEDDGARRFLADLAAYRPVVIRKFRADPVVVREVVRDTIVAVDGPLGHALRGMTPARHLSNYRTSPCVRPYGCPIQSACRASLGTFGAREVLRDFAEQGALEKHRDAPMVAHGAAAMETC